MTSQPPPEFLKPALQLAAGACLAAERLSKTAAQSQRAAPAVAPGAAAMADPATRELVWCGVDPASPSERQLQSRGWVKVAASPAIRTTGRWLGFFDWDSPAGRLRGGPLRAGLTSGLVGAGLGYTGAHLLSRLAPDRFDRKRLSRVATAVGALGGLGAGALVAGANRWVGLPAGSGVLLNPVTAKTASTGVADRSLDVDLDTMGRVLWDAGTSPDLTATTMGTLYAAAAMPDAQARPGWVTPAQMARLTAGMGAGYLSGAMVGSLLGAVTGLRPETQRTVARSGALVGLLNHTIPRLFG